MQRRWLAVLGVAGALLVALLLTACSGDAQEESAPAGGADDEAGEALIGTTPGKPALVEFYATW